MKINVIRIYLGRFGQFFVVRQCIPAMLVFVGLLQLSCIGDDIILDEVEPIIRIMNAIDTIELGTSYEFAYTYFNNTGQEEIISGVLWSSDNPAAINVDANGVATALELGSATVAVQFTHPDGRQIMDAHTVVVGDNTVSNDQIRSGTLRTTSSYKLTGSFTLQNEEDVLQLTFSDDYEASSNLPGLFIYLTNNPNTTNNAFEIGAVEVFKGAHTYTIENVEINDFSHVLYFCKPFVVKVGDGAFED